jgi:glycosyltransferase involved in cell wall biosynthesis
VGKQGWMVNELLEKMTRHPQFNQKLFWLAAISDEYLELLYTKCQCLIVASEGEGFGLPLIEAAMHGLPIIARDIPVFREVAGEHAFYFSGGPTRIAGAIKEWISLFVNKTHPKSDQISWKTWKQSAHSLLGLVLEP